MLKFALVSTPKVIFKQLPSYRRWNVSKTFLGCSHLHNCHQGRNEGGKGGTIPRRRITAGGAEWLRRAAKSPNNVTRTFFNTVHLLPRDLFGTWGRQTCFLPRAPSHLITPLTATYWIIYVFENPNVYNKSFFVLWLLWKTLTSTWIRLVGGCRADVIKSS